MVAYTKPQQREEMRVSLRIKIAFMENTMVVEHRVIQVGQPNTVSLTVLA